MITSERRNIKELIKKPPFCIKDINNWPILSLSIIKLE